MAFAEIGKLNTTLNYHHHTTPPQTMKFEKRLFDGTQSSIEFFNELPWNRLSPLTEPKRLDVWIEDVEGAWFNETHRAAQLHQFSITMPPMMR